MEQVVRVSVCMTLAATAWAPATAGVRVPASAVPEGWQPAGEPMTFGPDTLYEHINGAAPGYLRYDFIGLTVQPVEKADDPNAQVLVEIYEFGKHLDAFGIYSNERAPGLEFLPIGAEGYFAGPACRFYQGSHYVKLNGTRTGDDIEAAQRAIAGALARALGGERRAPAQLAAFPPEGLVSGSERYEGSDLLAHDFMGAGFIADYDLGGEKQSKLFFTVKASSGEAREAYWELLRFLRRRGEVRERLLMPGGRARVVRHPFYGPSMVCRTGPVVCGVLRMPSQEAGGTLVRELLARLGEMED